MNTTQTPDAPIPSPAGPHHNGAATHGLLDDADDAPEWIIIISAVKKIETFIGCDDEDTWRRLTRAIAEPQTSRALASAAAVEFHPSQLANYVEDLGIEVSRTLYVTARDYCQAIIHADTQVAVALITSCGFSVSDIDAITL